MKKKFFGSLMFIVLMFSGTASAQEFIDDIMLGKAYKMHSEILGEDRFFAVSLPENYPNSDVPYSVVYLLDGDAHFLHATGVISFLAGEGRMPNMIVVALPNTERTRDLTPETNKEDQERFPTAGGADNFLVFIEKELKPYIDKEYRTTGFDVLIGHSFGGLFAVHTLYEKPEVFDALIAVSPSLWWNNEYYTENIDKLEKLDLRNKFFYYSVGGNESERMVPPYKNFTGTMSKTDIEGFKWNSELMEGEDHGSTVHKTIYNAFEFIFKDWNLTWDTMLEGLDKVKSHYAGLKEVYGFKVYPSEGLLNQLGYAFLNRERIDEALETFEYAIELYPESANVYDSYGEGLEAAGKLDKASENYEKAIEKAVKYNHPNLPVFKDHLEALKRKLD